MEWWVTKGNQVPVGPVSTELLLRGISAGAVPRDALICEVGGSQWIWIGERAPFSIAMDERLARPLDSGEDVTLAEAPANDSLSKFDESPDQTTQTSIELPRRWFESLNDSEERTIVDIVPLPSSEPPTGA